MVIVTGVISFICGAIVGVALMCLMFAVREADDEYERYRRCKDVADKEENSWNETIKESEQVEK